MMLLTVIFSGLTLAICAWGTAQNEKAAARCTEN